MLLQNNNSVICTVGLTPMKREYLIRKSNKENENYKNHQDVAADRILDVRSIWNSPLEENIRIDENLLRLFCHIKWRQGGIVSWIDKTGMELIRWDRNIMLLRLCMNYTTLMKEIQ